MCHVMTCDKTFITINNILNTTNQTIGESLSLKNDSGVIIRKPLFLNTANGLEHLSSRYIRTRYFLVVYGAIKVFRQSQTLRDSKIYSQRAIKKHLFLKIFFSFHNFVLRLFE